MYEFKELEWIAVTDELAVCRYRFFWNGTVDGRSESGQGRGTNVVVKRNGHWKVLYEHLSR